MGFRTVVVASRSHCSFENNYMVVRNSGVAMVHLSEIDMVIADTPAVTFTGVLLSEFAKNRIVLLCCNEKHMPSSLTLPLYSNSASAGKLRKQVEWSPYVSADVWKYVVRQKIKSEIGVLGFFGRDAVLLESYADDITPSDNTNREGLAAKVYFASLFGDDFIRHAADGLNASLDYGYAMILSLVTRNILCAGYCTEIGIHHANDQNSYNLACDLMEPFRAAVDMTVAAHYSGAFDKEMKEWLWKIPEIKIRYRGKEQYLSNAVRLWVHDILSSLDSGSDIQYEISYPC